MPRYDNYPDDIRNFDDDPRSPFYDDGGYSDRVVELTEEILDDADPAAYIDMFDSMDSDDVVVLLKDFHMTQSEESIKQLISKLDDMLVAHAESLLEGN